jgi:hypothetical protein
LIVVRKGAGAKVHREGSRHASRPVGVPVADDGDRKVVIETVARPIPIPNKALAATPLTVKTKVPLRLLLEQ